MRTLIVEDVDSMRELLEQVLRGCSGYSVSGLARNGAEARFELVRRRPELVLLDEVLPGESSLDLLEELKKQGIPVILVTSLADRSADLPPGALSRLFKPTWKSLSADIRRFQAELDQALKRG